MINFANKLYAHQNPGKKKAFQKKEEASFYVKNLLRTAAFSWLLIFDNAPTFADIKDDIPETHGAKDKHVIVTSLSERDGPGILRLSALTDGEAVAFLRHYLQDAQDEDLKNLAKTLENHPLALLQAAAYINATPGMGVPAYIAFFTENKKAYWASESKALRDQPLLSTAIKMSIDKLKEANPDDYTLLVALCLLDTTHLDKTLIEKLYINLTKGNMGGFGRILDVALIAPEGHAAYRVHDYVREVILASADQQTLKQAASLATTTFLPLFPEKIEDCVAVFDKDQGLSSHLKKLAERMDLSPTNEMFGVALRLFYYSDVIARDYAFAQPFSTKLKNFIDANLTLDPYLAGVFYSWYGDAQTAEKGTDVAISEFKRADEFFKKSDPEKARYGRVMLLANNLGFFLHWKGDLVAADDCLQEAKRLQAGYDDLLPQTAIMELEAVLAQDKGDHEKSINILNRELDLIKDDKLLMKSLGHFAKSLKACALLKLAEQKEQRKDQKESIALRREAYRVSLDAYKHAVESSDGDESAPVVARTLLYLSQSQSALGEFYKAEETAKKAVSIFNKIYDQPNRRQAIARIALADSYMGQKRFQEALDTYLEAEKIFDKISSHKAFDDMSELYAKIVNAGIILKDGMVAREYALRHRETFPKSHDRFVAIFHAMTKAGYDH